jgi:hypothetical protein
MNIELHGLTKKQMIFCDIMWALETREAVESFIATLPTKDQRTCKILIEMMQLAFLDAVDSTDEANEVLDNIRKI